MKYYTFNSLSKAQMATLRSFQEMDDRRRNAEKFQKLEWRKQFKNKNKCKNKCKH
jgi:hypothetical protein